MSALPEHKETRGHALAAVNRILFLRGSTHQLEKILGNSKILLVVHFLASDGMHNT